MSGASLNGPVEAMESGGRALKLQTDTPHLVSMGGDRLSTSVTLHPIPQGRVVLGSGSGVDIPVQGTGVLPIHCHIENSEGVVTIYPTSENLSIDGVKVIVPTRLSQGCMLTIGRSNYMRFNHPAEAKLMKSILPNPRISMPPITFEPEGQYQAKYVKKPPTVPRKSPRESLSDSGSEDAPSSIMTKVSKFEYLAAQNLKKSISPKVFSINSVKVNTPAKDVLGKSPPDLQNYAKNLPQSALNYSELNYNEKHQIKIPERQLFGKKSPAYVNVTLNEAKHINNRVVIYENGCVPKTHNVNFDHNELNIKTSSSNKNINVNRVMIPSPSYNRNPTPYYRSVTPNPISNNINTNHRSGSLDELTNGSFYGSSEELETRSKVAELKRNQAQQDRMKEQELEKAEQARLEEILNMCAEYEKQSQNEKNKPITPNRIKTNGSLPRDKRHQLSQSPFGSISPSYGSPPLSPADIAVKDHHNQTNSYENVTIMPYPTPRNKVMSNYENIEFFPHDSDPKHYESVGNYENVYIQQNNSGQYPPSPRTRIKTFVTSSKEHSPKEPNTITDNKFAILEKEQYLLENLNKTKTDSSENRDELNECSRKPTPTKFILPLENLDAAFKDDNKTFDSITENISSINTINSIHLSMSDDHPGQEKKELRGVDKTLFNKLKMEKKDLSDAISGIKRLLGEIEIQEEELHREMDMERALLSGEHKSKLLDLEKIQTRKQKLVKHAQRIEDSMRDCQVKQEQDQKDCKEKLEVAQENMTQIEAKLAATEKSTPEYENVFEQYLKFQETLDNERKAFEDLEFHHLEEEADWLASREELQREIVDLSKKIDNLETQIQELEEQNTDAANSNTEEYKILESQKIKCLVKLEEIRNRLKLTNRELSTFPYEESEPETSSGSESDRSKDTFFKFDMNSVRDLSCSIIVSNSKLPFENPYNMSQSFNEKLFHEKSILETGMEKKFPSQDDIDRISKVTSDAPLDIGSLNKKTVESLKEIERNRHLHLCQQGSQVIEQERQKMLELKQRAQQEVRNKWAQRIQDCSSFTSTGSEDTSNGGTDHELSDQKNESKVAGSGPDQTETIRNENEDRNIERPLSEVSEMSLEAGTLNRKRGKPHIDKQRPLTRYLPIRDSELDLRRHIESAGHQVVLCPHVIINTSTCRGFLHKRGSKLNGWSRRWFVFDRNKHTFSYYSDKSEKKPRGGAYFQAIEEVYLDHSKIVKSPNPQLTFIVKTHERVYYLMAPSPESMRIWVDVIFTGAEGYQEFEHGT